MNDFKSIVKLKPGNYKFRFKSSDPEFGFLKEEVKFVFIFYSYLVYILTTFMIYSRFHVIAKFCRNAKAKSWHGLKLVDD